MTAYFDAQITRLRVLQDATYADDPDAFGRLVDLDRAVVWDVTLAVESPGCPEDLREAVHRVVLRYSLQSQSEDQPGPDYEDDATYACGLVEMVERLHSIFHELGQRGLDDFTDSPRTPIEALYFRGEGRRAELARANGGRPR